MQAPSVFNEILGPVMRGPSSSHTAGSFHIAVLARALLGGTPVRARFVFDPAGSYAQVYEQQGVDRAFAAGLLGWKLTDERFFEALQAAAAEGIDIGFRVEPIAGADHPNTVEITLESATARAALRAKSVGGGAIEIVRVGEWTVRLTGETWCALVECRPAVVEQVASLPLANGGVEGAASVVPGASASLVVTPRVEPLGEDLIARIRGIRRRRGRQRDPPDGLRQARTPALCLGRTRLLALADGRGWSLGQTALAYEAALLGLDDGVLEEEMRRRFEIMRAAVHAGLSVSARRCSC